MIHQLAKALKTPHGQKVALMSVLMVALGSSLSWNPENTQIVRNERMDVGETMLAVEKDPFDAAPARATTPAKEVDKSVPLSDVKITVSDVEALRKEIAKMREAQLSDKKIQAELADEKEEKEKKRKKKKDDRKFPTIVNDCKDKRDVSDDDDDEDADLDDEKDRRSSRVARRVRDRGKDQPNGDYLECLKDQITTELDNCSARNNKELTKSERKACRKQVAKFYHKHMSPVLKADLKKGADTEQLKEAASVAADLIAEFPNGGEFSKIKKEITKFTKDGAVVRGKDLAEATIDQLGDTPQNRVYALQKMRMSIACEMGLQCPNFAFMTQHGIPNGNFMGALMREAWTGSGKADDTRNFYKLYFDALRPYTKQNGPTDLIDGKLDGNGVVDIRARGSLPQFTGIPKTSQSSTAPQWKGGAAPAGLKPVVNPATGAPSFNGGPSGPTGQYPQTGAPGRPVLK